MCAFQYFRSTLGRLPQLTKVLFTPFDACEKKLKGDLRVLKYSSPYQQQQHVSSELTEHSFPICCLWEMLENGMLANI